MRQDALTKDGLRLFPKLKRFGDFYLAGGTALALQMGHRISVDFDLFCQNEIPKNLLDKVEGVFSDPQEDISPVINNPEELTVLIGGIKITFLKYPFPVIDKFVEFEGLKMLGALELAATKAYTIGRRGSFKDYVDVFFALSGGFADLNRIIELAEKKYGNEFNSRLFLEQLIYLDDVEEIDLIFLKEPVNKKQIRDFFIREVKKIKF
ncbi:MAG: nucleotidyl transferase AbiEii/AbiGii toxin family protein [Patescibacteria group bacterium]